MGWCRTMLLPAVALAALAALAACGDDTPATSTPTSTTATSATPTTPSTATTGDGAGTATALPLGDGRVTTAPEAGSVYSCITEFGGAGGGAFRDGPWIDAAANTWDPTRKIAVQGSVEHDAEFAVSESGGQRRLVGNGLPTTPTGVFPVAADDPAYDYDRNPNTITAYELDAGLPLDPEVAAEPSCVGGTIGVSLLGAPIFSAFDALGRDAVAHEVQDDCDGHPERTGQYHFHSLSSCFTGVAADSAVAGVAGDDGLFGYALDGFGIYVEHGPDGEELTTADLDACHGRTSEVVWHGEPATIYHYVATVDFPYLVGCFMGTPITAATGLQLGPP